MASSVPREPWGCVSHDPLILRRRQPSTRGRGLLRCEQCGRGASALAVGTAPSGALVRATAPAPASAGHAAALRVGCGGRRARSSLVFPSSELARGGAGSSLEQAPRGGGGSSSSGPALQAARRLSRSSVSPGHGEGVKHWQAVRCLKLHTAPRSHTEQVAPRGFLRAQRGPGTRG